MGDPQDRDSASSLGTLCPHLVTLTVGKCCLAFRGNLPRFGLCHVQGTHKRSRRCHYFLWENSFLSL